MHLVSTEWAEIMKFLKVDLDTRPSRWGNKEPEYYIRNWMSEGWRASQLRWAVSDGFCNRLKLTIWHSHPLHTKIGWVCRGEKGARVIFHHRLFSCEQLSATPWTSSRRETVHNHFCTYLVRTQRNGQIQILPRWCCLMTSEGLLQFSLSGTSDYLYKIPWQSIQ